MQIHFIRHGQSEANLSKSIIQGQLNSPLSDRGKDQAAKLSEKLTFDFDKVYASPLDRAKDTAKISLSRIGWNVDDIIYEDELKEISMGNFEGLTFESLGLSREMMAPIVNLEGDVMIDIHQGESVFDFKQRTIDIFQKITDEAQQNGIESILIYSHGGVMRAILKHYLDIYEGPYFNTQIVSIELQNGSWRLIGTTENIV